MFPLYTNINFDSNDDISGDNQSKMVKKFSSPLTIPNDGKNHFIKIMNGKIPMTVHNITDDINNHLNKINNTIRYSVNAGGDYKVLTFLNGIYGPYGIDSDIKALLYSNGDYITDSNTGEIIYPFILSASESSSFGYLTIDKRFTGYTNVIVDLSNNTTSYFYLLYGFGISQVVLDGSATTQVVSSGLLDIYDSQFSINCDKVISYVKGFSTGNVLYYGNLNGKANGYKFIKANEDIIGFIQPGTKVINTIEIRFVDRSDDLLIFGDTSSIDSNITLSLSIY